MNRFLFRITFIFIICVSFIRCTHPQFTFVKVPVGKYLLGKKDHFINPLHEVMTNGFEIASTEITNEQFSEFVNATNYVTVVERRKDAMTFHPGLEEFEWVKDSTASWRFPFGKDKGGIENKMNHPVTCVCYDDAIAFCQWANVRLPTYDEWEIACHAGTTTNYYWGNDSSKINEYANIWTAENHLRADSTDKYIYTSPIGSFKPNAWGLYDMLGNVFELCEGKPAFFNNMKNVTASRGGSWWCSANSCNYFDDYDIGRLNKEASFSNVGFRVVKK